MDRKIPLVILAIVLVVITVAILIPGGRQADTNPKLPWQIEVQADGSTQVFGLTLEQSTLRQATDLLGQDPTLSLFRSPEGEIAVEAYFQRASLSGLRADFIFTLKLDDQTAEQIYNRGARISQLGSGSKKVELADADKALALDSPVEHLTYIPQADLEPQLIERQFGTPARKLADPEGAEHWLYPAKGLDIAVNAETKEVFQYVHPQRFEQLIAPLLAAAEDGAQAQDQ